MCFCASEGPQEYILCIKRICNLSVGVHHNKPHQTKTGLSRVRYCANGGPQEYTTGNHTATPF